MIDTTRRNLLKQLAWVPAAPLLSSCATNLATGRSNLAGLVSTADEVKMGAANHDEIINTYGGVVSNTVLKNYVNSVGLKLSKYAEYPEYDYNFTLLDTNITNAFASPGGYTYFTKGIMALASSETEFASVVAHELGHVNARHIAEKLGDATVTDFFSAVLGAATTILVGSSAGSAVSTLVTGGGAIFLNHFSQTQEYEADMLAVRYMNKAGYNTNGIVTLFEKLRLIAILESTQLGLDPTSVDDYNFLATHPRTLDRIEAAMKEAENLKIQNKTQLVNTESYLHNIDGLSILRDSKKGMLYKNQYINTTVGASFSIPSSFVWTSDPSKSLAVSSDKKKVISVSQADQTKSKTKKVYSKASDYLKNVWQPSGGYSKIENDLYLNGCSVAAAYAVSDKNVYIVNVAIIPSGSKNVIGVTFLSQGGAITLNTDFVRSTVASIKQVTTTNHQSLVLRAHQVRQGDSIQSLSKSFQYKTSAANMEYFKIINGIKDNIQVGQLVKIAGWG